MDQGQNYNRGDCATSSFLCSPLLCCSYHDPPSSLSQSPNLSFACSRCIVCSAQHAFTPQPHSLCAEFTHLPAKLLAFGSSQYVCASLCQHAVSPAVCTACGWEIGVGMDIEDFKYVSISMPSGHISRPSEYESALARHSFSMLSL